MDTALNQSRALLRRLGVILAVIFAAEVAVMLLLPLALWSGAGPLAEAVLDSVALAILCAPLLWWKIVRPLQTGIVAEQARLRDLLDAAPDGVIGCDPAGRIVLANRRIAELFGYPPAELIGRPVDLLVPERFREAHVGLREAYLDAGTPRIMDPSRQILGMRADGTEFPAEISLSISETKNGTLVLAAVRDVSGRKKIERELRDANETLRLGVAELEHRNRETIVINEMGGLLQSCRTVDEVWKVFGEFAGRIFPDARGAVYKLDPDAETAERVVAWGEPPQPDFRLERDSCRALRSGRPHRSDSSESLLPCRRADPSPGAGCVCVPILDRGETLGVMLVALGEGEVGGSKFLRRLEAVVVIVAERVGLAIGNVELQENLRNQSIRDSLTGLFNRRYLDERLDQALSQAREVRQPVAVILLDIDHFKQVNDLHGHEAGDCVLQSISSVLMRNVRPDDVACRYGGEEFLMILPGASLEVARARAELLREKVEALDTRYRGQVLGAVTVSAGVASFPESGLAPGDLLHDADAALYRAKAEGRNRVAVASSRVPQPPGGC